MILSFGWTTKALLDGKKTVTRRVWTEKYFEQWKSAWARGDHRHRAYDRSPRSGGKPIGIIVLTCEPYKERLRDMPIEDLKAEGGLWASKEEFMEAFGGPDVETVVVRFVFEKTGEMSNRRRGKKHENP